MPWNKCALLLVVIALVACSPAEQKAAQPQANKMVADNSKPIGHSPHPFLDVGRTDLFHGYRCGVADCLLHQQGYKWGADHRIANPGDCRGTSEEFIEGCRAFAGLEGPLGEREFDASFPH